MLKLGSFLSRRKTDIPGLDQDKRQLDCRSEAPNFSPAWTVRQSTEKTPYVTLHVSHILTLQWQCAGGIFKDYGRLMNVVGCWYRKMQFHGLVQHPRALRWWHLRWFSPAQRDIFQTLSDGPSKQTFWCIKVTVVVSCRSRFALWKDAIPMLCFEKSTKHKVS